MLGFFIVMFFSGFVVLFVYFSANSNSLYISVVG